MSDLANQIIDWLLERLFLAGTFVVMRLFGDPDVPWAEA